jgi:hypothetical protein
LWLLAGIFFSSFSKETDKKAGAAMLLCKYKY